MDVFNSRPYITKAKIFGQVYVPVQVLSVHVVDAHGKRDILATVCQIGQKDEYQLPLHKFPSKVASELVMLAFQQERG